VLKAHVKALRAVECRSAGEPIDTPKPPAVITPNVSGETLSAAFDGWKKAKARPQATLNEYERAITQFRELHGDLPVVQPDGNWLKHRFAAALRNASIVRARRGYSHALLPRKAACEPMLLAQSPPSFIPKVGGKIAQLVRLPKGTPPHQCPPAVSPVSPSSARYCIVSSGTANHSPSTSI
jgi:hypothetical protein